MIATAPPRVAPIAVRGVGKVYPARRGSFVALHDVSFSVAPGEFCAIIGPSGCGKTTLLHILAGLLPASTGTVEIPPQEPGRLVTALIFQGISTLPWLTVLQNAEYGLRHMRVSPAERRTRAVEQLRRVGLDRFGDAFPHQLSEGMRQRVSIARALATDPDVLLMDEPFANLDEQNRLLLQDELLRLWQENRQTVLFVTHSLDEAIRLSDRVLVMTSAPGRIKAEVPVRLARPREFRSVRQDPEYGALSAKLWEALRDEVLRARQA